MIENSTVYCIYLGVILTFLGPMVLTLAGIVFKKFRIAPIFVGMLVYIVSSYLIRLPMVLGLNAMGVYEAIQANTFLFAAVSSFMIALSLGIGRILGWLPSKKNHDYNGALSLGFGMGALDCVLMLGLDMFSTMMLVKAYNAGTFQELMAGMDAEYVAQLTAAITQTEGYVYVLSSLERIVLLLLEMVMSVLLFKFWEKKDLLKGALVTIGISWFVMLAASLLYSMNVYLGAIYLLLCGATGIYFLWQIGKMEPKEEVAVSKIEESGKVETTN